MASGWMPRTDSALCRRFANVAVCIIRAGSPLACGCPYILLFSPGGGGGGSVVLANQSVS